MTDKAPPAADDSVPRSDESLQTGVLDTPGAEPHAQGVRSDSGPGATPTDVDQANPLAQDPGSPLGPGDAGTGIDTTGRQGG